MPSSYGEYEAVIGLEVHAQLLTRTKLFCACATSFGDPPNTHTCPVCLGLPGALPTLNGVAVHLAARAALALGCATPRTSVFARKNYFYPDLPKGYQISQYELPLAVNGALEIEAGGALRRVTIRRVHMEEDAGKNVHGMGDTSIVDLNRAGTPLIEIVGEPDLRSGPEAAEYLKRLREVLMFIGVNDGNLEQGSFRCDANVSIRKKGDSTLGTRTELKNINSFRFVEAAIDVEIRRQIALLERGDRVRQETRGYNADKRETYLLRDKANEAGYRYFPEPDLPPLVVDAAFVAEVRAGLPISPTARRRRWVERLGLSPYAAGVLSAHPLIAAFFEATADLVPNAQKAANFIQGEVLRDVRTDGLSAELPCSPSQVAELLRLVDAGTISGKQAKEVYALMRGTGDAPFVDRGEPRHERDQRRGPARGSCAQARGGEPQAGRRLPRRQGQPARLLRGHDDEAHGRQRRSGGREPRAQARARRRRDEGGAPSRRRPGRGDRSRWGAPPRPRARWGTPARPRARRGPAPRRGCYRPRTPAGRPLDPGPETVSALHSVGPVDSPAIASRPDPESVQSPLAQSVAPGASEGPRGSVRADDAHQRLRRPGLRTARARRARSRRRPSPGSICASA